MGQILVTVAVGVVAVVLIVGLYSLYRGGDFARSYSNKIMRLRIVAQFVAIVIIMAVLYFWGRGPGAN
ncbi:MAG: twin transmembrane helix small protein [Alphaproteobacteria bacterium]|nr:twin transmembrane helix small protein [Alphaproteobacteria bacterium]